MMKLRWILLIASGMYALLGCSQKNGLSLVYTVSDKQAGDHGGRLNILSKAGKSLNEFVEAPGGKILDKSIRLRSQPRVDYRLLAGALVKIPDEQLKNYEMTVLGNDVVNGYACVKVSVRRYKGGEANNLWLTTAIPGYEAYLDAFVDGFDLSKLKAIPVRIEYSGETARVLELASVSRVDLDDALFNAGGSTESKGHSSEELKKRNEVTDEQYEMMKIEEERARKELEERKDR